MSSVTRLDIAHAFVTLYDALHARHPVTTELEAWPDTSEFANGQSELLRAVDEDATVDSDVVSEAVSADSPRLFGALTAADLVLSAANSETPSPDPATSLLQERRRRHGSYFNSVDLGAVLAKRVDQRQVQEGNESLSDALGVLRVHAETWSAVEHVLIARDLDHNHSPGSALRLAAVPVSAESGDLRMTSTSTEQGRRIYLADPDPGLAARVPAAAAALVDADIGLAPEVTLDGDILRAWQAALDPVNSPTWVFAGTGPVPGAYVGASAPVGAGKTVAGDRLSPNRGVLLHGITGTVIAVQDKRAGFTITADLLDAYGLAGAPTESHDEGMEPGSKLTVIESLAGRFAIYICEDLGREMDLAPELIELGITHLIVPILATEMLDHRWQQQSSSQIAQRAGTTTMVVNSVTLGRFTNDGEPARTFLVAEPRHGTYAPDLHWAHNPDAKTMSPRDDATTPRVLTTRSR